MSKKRCEIICVGTELLLGEILNINAQFLARGLSQLGLDLYIQTVVGDNEARLKKAIYDAMNRAEILLFTGGLGPTRDDLTKEAVAECFQTELYLDQDALNEIKAFYALTKRVMPHNNEKQALMPRKGQMLKNPHGTAPGCVMWDDKGHTAFLMPGPPREMMPMFDHEVVPRLKAYSDSALFSSVVRVASLGESRMAEMLQDLMDKGQNPTLAPYAKDGESSIRLTARAKTKEEAEALIKPVIAQIRQRLGKAVYGVDVKNLESVIADQLTEKQMSLCVLEAGTGGLAAKRLQETDRAEDIFRLGLSANTIEGLYKALGEGNLPEDPTQACRELAALAQKRFQTPCALVINQYGSSYACAALLNDKTAERAGAFPLRGREYYSLQAAQNALDALRLLLEED
ncbi:MAG: CinA family nicotinamide mononucleotide deamidase-related protein [Bacillota bacterium]|nr:CinA family nicotinamide mononucleotide deamidase-related protein [Bacillota bacterium]